MVDESSTEALITHCMGTAGDTLCHQCVEGVENCQVTTCQAHSQPVPPQGVQPLHGVA